MVHPLLVTTIVLAILTVGFGGISIWAYVNYLDQKNNVDAKISTAVAEAKRTQTADDEKLFVEREKQPTREIVGPDDLGRLSLSYPKTWSVYLDKNGTGNQYEAYFYPAVVPPLSLKTPNALRISIENSPYETQLASFQELVKSGALKASPVAAQGETGTRLDGAFSKTVQGSMVLFKVRDKTIKVFTESTAFQSDFNTIVLPSLKFNK